MRKWLASVACAVVIAPPGWAQDTTIERAGDFVFYSMSMQGSRVKGAMLVARLVNGREIPTGYSLQEVVNFITEDCASGKVHTVKLGKRHTRESRGFVQQKFKAFCLGGPHPDIGAVTDADIRVERQRDGRNLAEYTFWQEGGTVTIERYR